MNSGSVRKRRALLQKAVFVSSLALLPCARAGAETERHAPGRCPEHERRPRARRDNHRSSGRFFSQARSIQRFAREFRINDLLPGTYRVRVTAQDLRKPVPR